MIFAIFRDSFRGMPNGSLSIRLHSSSVFFYVTSIIMSLGEICGERRNFFLLLIIDALDDVPNERETSERHLNVMFQLRNDI